MTDADIEMGLQLDAKYRESLKQMAVCYRAIAYEDLTDHASQHYADALREVKRLREELREREESDKAERTCDHCGAYDDGYEDMIQRYNTHCRVWNCGACGYVTPI